MAKTTEKFDLNEYLSQRVPVILKRPESEKKEFRTVTINGKTFQIAYGQKVMIPRYVAQVIEEGLKNEQIAKCRAEEKSEAFLMGKSSFMA